MSKTRLSNSWNQLTDEEIREQFSKFGQNKKNIISLPKNMKYDETDYEFYDWVECHNIYLNDIFLIFVDRLKDIKPEYKENEKDFFLFCDFIYEFSI